MKELFKNILLPVDLTRKEAHGQIEKAISIANRLDCDLHVIYIDKHDNLSLKEYLTETDPALKLRKSRQALLDLQRAYCSQLNDEHSLVVEYNQGNAEIFIIEYCIKKNIDLIITKKPSFRSLFANKLSIKRLARRTGCPVISINNKINIQQLKNIVIPVNEKLPVRKLMFSSYLARKFQARIHLIAVPDHTKTDQAEASGNLYRAYQLLRTHTSVAVECHPVTGEHIADTTLNYARRIKADLIVVDSSNQESLLSGLVNRLFTRFIFNQSRIPVMTIAST